MVAGEGPPSRPRVKPHCLERMEQNASGFRIGTCPGSGRHLASRGTPKSTASPCTAQPRGDAEWQGELRSLAKTIPPRLRQQISSGTLHSSYPLPILISGASPPTVLLLSLQESLPLPLTNSVPLPLSPSSSPQTSPFLTPFQACLHLFPSLL